MRTGSQRDRELGAVGVLASVGHRQQARTSVPSLKGLIFEVTAVNGEPLLLNT